MLTPRPGNSTLIMRWAFPVTNVINVPPAKLGGSSLCNVQSKLTAEVTIPGNNRECGASAPMDARSKPEFHNIHLLLDSTYSFSSTRPLSMASLATLTFDWWLIEPVSSSTRPSSTITMSIDTMLDTTSIGGLLG